MLSRQDSYVVPKVSQITTHHSDQLREIIPRWQVEYIQLSKGKFYFSTDFLQIGDFQFGNQIFGASTLTQGQVPADSFAIAIPQSFLGHSIFLGHEIKCNAMFTSTDTFDFITGEQFHFFTIMFPLKQILAHAEAIQCTIESGKLRFPGMFLASCQVFNCLNNYLKEIALLVKNQSEQLQDLVNGLVMADIIVSDLLPLFVDVLVAEPAIFLPQQISRYGKIVKEAEAFVRDNIQAPITLKKLCEHLTISQRSLNYAFQAVYRLSPMEYLKILRLNQVRWALKKSDPTTSQVTGIANCFGFWHMGQFGVDYKKMFGEMPKTTLESR